MNLRDVKEDISATIVWRDEAEAPVLLIRFDATSLYHSICLERRSGRTPRPCVSVLNGLCALISRNHLLPIPATEGAQLAEFIGQIPERLSGLFGGCTSSVFQVNHLAWH